MIVADAWLDYWGEVFTAHPCLRRCCTFEQFLRRPHRIIAALAGDGLLPQQRAVQARIDQSATREAA